jgi:hypothetical protein
MIVANFLKIPFYRCHNHKKQHQFCIAKTGTWINTTKARKQAPLPRSTSQQAPRCLCEKVTSYKVTRGWPLEINELEFTEHQPPRVQARKLALHIHRIVLPEITRYARGNRNTNNFLLCHWSIRHGQLSGYDDVVSHSFPRSWRVERTMVVISASGACVHEFVGLFHSRLGFTFWCCAFG